MSSQYVNGDQPRAGGWQKPHEDAPNKVDFKTRAGFISLGPRLRLVLANRTWVCVLAETGFIGYT
jgi:hypothetical protein